VQWWQSYGPSRGYDNRLLIAIPNGAMLAGDTRLRSIQARRLKDEGVQAGVPDLFLAVSNVRGTKRWYGLWIEMKRSCWRVPLSGKAKEHWLRQSEMRLVLSVAGYATTWCRGFDDAKLEIEDYLR
jgi:hypothetical protein